MGIPRLARVVALGVVLGSLAPGPDPARADAECAAWPGEPTPLPSVDDTDSARTRWAALRAEELVLRAQLAEATDPVESHRLWRRALCLDPESEAAWRGLARTRPVRVHRPTLRWGPRAPAAADPWPQLAAVVSVPRPVPPSPPLPRAPLAPEPAPSPEALARAETLVQEGEESLRGARFEEALGRALAARDALEPWGEARGAAPVRVRLEIVAATAQVALGDEDAARQSFRRALAVEPGLSLDPAETSPKVLRALEAARGGAEAAP